METYSVSAIWGRPSFFDDSPADPIKLRSYDLLFEKSMSMIQDDGGNHENADNDVILTCGDVALN